MLSLLIRLVVWSRYFRNCKVAPLLPFNMYLPIMNFLQPHDDFFSIHVVTSLSIATSDFYSAQKVFPSSKEVYYSQE